MCDATDREVTFAKDAQVNAYRIHLQLSDTIRNASRLREELKSGHLSPVRRLGHRIKHTYLLIHIRNLTAQLHSRI